MPQVLTREPSDGETASGRLRTEHFQMAHVTTDLDRACGLLGDQLVIRHWASLGPRGHRAACWPVAHHGVNPPVEVCFVDVPDLGNYLTYPYATPVGLDSHVSVPRS